jgi:hypothetical protein
MQIIRENKPQDVNLETLINLDEQFPDLPIIIEINLTNASDTFKKFSNAHIISEWNTLESHIISIYLDELLKIVDKDLPLFNNLLNCKIKLGGM